MKGMKHGHRGIRLGSRSMWLLLFTVGMLAVLPGGAALGTSPFVAVDLGTPGGSTSHPSAMNESGQVVGVSYTAGDAAALSSVIQQGSGVTIPPA